MILSNIYSIIMALIMREVLVIFLIDITEINIYLINKEKQKGTRICTVTFLHKHEEDDKTRL